MTTRELNELALHAWKEAMGDALTAVKLLRDCTDLGLRDAFELIQKTALRVGCDAPITTQVPVPDEVADLEPNELANLLVRLRGLLARAQTVRDTHRAAHHAMRGVKKVRGAK